MKLIKTSIEDLVIIEPDVFSDERGYFYESFQKIKFQELRIRTDFVQDNESKSSRGVLRGLHFQNPPYAQGKLIRVVKGRVLDVAVDIRKKSPTFGKWESVELSSDNKLMIWVPEGFAHGFLVLEDDTIFHYKCTNYYDKTSEGAILWNDPDLQIDWKYDNPILSDKDASAPGFKDMISLF